jgi:hypothetical protein
MDLILILSKFSGQIAPKHKAPNVLCPFNNLTVLTGLAVLMEAP